MLNLINFPHNPKAVDRFTELKKIQNNWGQIFKLISYIKKQLKLYSQNRQESISLIQASREQMFQQLESQFRQDLFGKTYMDGKKVRQVAISFFDP